MPKISEFYGIIVYMYVLEQHGTPHVHVKYGDSRASVDINTGGVLAGELPRAQMKYVNKWIKMHRAELLEDWNLAAQGRHPNPVEPLK